MQEKNTLKNKQVKVVDFFHKEILIFLLQNALNTIYNSYYDYWDLITKFWPGSTKCNTPFQIFKNVIPGKIFLCKVACRKSESTNT